MVRLVVKSTFIHAEHTPKADSDVDEDESPTMGRALTDGDMVKQRSRADRLQRMMFCLDGDDDDAEAESEIPTSLPSPANDLFSTEVAEADETGLLRGGKTFRRPMVQTSSITESESQTSHSPSVTPSEPTTPTLAEQTESTAARPTKRILFLPIPSVVHAREKDNEEVTEHVLPPPLSAPAVEAAMAASISDNEPRAPPPPTAAPPPPRPPSAPAAAAAAAAVATAFPRPGAPTSAGAASSAAPQAPPPFSALGPARSAGPATVPSPAQAGGLPPPRVAVQRPGPRDPAAPAPPSIAGPATVPSTAQAGGLPPPRVAVERPGPRAPAAQAPPSIAGVPLGAATWPAGFAQPASGGAAAGRPGQQPPPEAADAPTKESMSDPAPTTIMLRNLPNNYTRHMVLRMLNKEGFSGLYDFLYLPMDFKTRACLGYCFVNFSSPESAVRCWNVFEGYMDWVLPSKKKCYVSWSGPHQGLEAHVQRYRNSPLMHNTVPEEYKPVMFRDGRRIPFPPPTKVPWAPRAR